MARQRDGQEKKHVNIDKNKLLDEIFTTPSAEDQDLTISIDWSDKHFEKRPKSAESAASTLKKANLSPFSPFDERATHQKDDQFGNLYSDHTVGRTRVPWHSQSTVDLRKPDMVPTRIVAFDVGGKLFRCKESLIAKHPYKRLHQIINCGCGKVSCLDDAFFIDRNPQHFEMILDWYRTGKLVRQRDVNDEAFKADAIYFDLYEELFPATLPGDSMQPWSSTKASAELPPRRRSDNDVDLGGSSKTKRVSMFANMPSPPARPPSHPKVTQDPLMTEKIEKSHDIGLSATIDDAPLRFFRHERRILTPTSLPLVFMMRKFEQLFVESIKGRGKLMVRACDAAGVQIVDVPEAVLFDSTVPSYQKGTGAQLQQQNALLPGSHVYTFWMIENVNDHNFGPPTLDIAFKLLFTFDPVDRLTSTMEVELTRATPDGFYARTPEGTQQGNMESCLPSCHFVPPSQVILNGEIFSSPDETKKRPYSTKQIMQEVSVFSKTKLKGAKRGKQHDQSSIRHAGAEMMRAAQRFSSSNETHSMQPHSESSNRRLSNQIPYDDL